MPSLDNGFTNWDDRVYVHDNELVTQFGKHDFSGVFTQPVSLNYHPFTILSLTANYQVSGLDAGSYHLTSLLIHLLNVLLLFWFVYWLTDRKWLVAALCALWFGIHPMHTESVAWVAARKDVLYVFFFLGALLTYLKYVKVKRKSWLLLTFLLMLCSLLSKATAVVLPLILLLIDYFKDRKWERSVWLEKVPFLLLSLVFGVLAFTIQSRGAIAEFETFPFYQRLMFAAYGLVMYMVKLLMPFKLSAFHPYPVLSESGYLPWMYYVAPVMVLLLVGLVWLAFRKRLKWVVFGILFFMINVALVLQLVSVGNAIMADRYTYLAHTGLIFIMAYGLHTLVNKNKKLGWALGVFLLVWSGVFAFQTYERNKVWKNSDTLWTDVLSKYNYAAVAYRNRGNFYAQNGQTDKALQDYEVLMRMGKGSSKIYGNLGNIYGLKGDIENAMKAYGKALEKNPKNFEVHFNRGTTYARYGNLAEAIADFDKAQALNPRLLKVYAARGLAYIQSQEFGKAIKDYDFLIKNQPTVVEYYANRALSHFNMGNNAASLQGFEKAIALQPNFKDAYFYKARILAQSGKFGEALQAANKAAELGYAVPAEFMNQLQPGK